VTTIKLLKWTVATAILLSTAVLGLIFVSLSGPGDPFDRFEVLSVLSDHANRRHAVTYKYHHANSSANVHAVWILDSPHAVGSKEPPYVERGAALISKSADMYPVAWSIGRLVMTVPSGVNVNTTSVTDCAFIDEQILCIDPTQMDVVRTTVAR
jgi:hypothetical protein